MRVIHSSYVAILGALLLQAQENPREIVKRSVEADSRGTELRRDYTYKVLDVRRLAGGEHSTLTDVLYVGGRPYRHVLARDGKPLPEAEANASREALDRAVQEATRMSPEEKKLRQQQYLKARAKEREEFKYIPDAFDFRIVGEPIINGRETWQIQASPRKEYKGPFAFLFHNMEGTLWVDKRDYQWVKVDADALNTISYGWFLARVAKGAHIAFENMRLNDELWAPKKLTIHGSARIALFKKLSADQELTFSDYRKFQTDSKMVDFEGDK